MTEMQVIPIVNIEPLVIGSKNSQTIAAEIHRACRELGFFYVVRHGIDEDLQRDIELLSREFFDRELERKLVFRMELGGRAWRGYSQVGREMTSGQPDQKEGIYYGAELPTDHSMVASSAFARPESVSWDP